MRSGLMYSPVPLNGIPYNKKFFMNAQNLGRAVRAAEMALAAVNTYKTLTLVGGKSTKQPDNRIVTKSGTARTVRRGAASQDGTRSYAPAAIGNLQTTRVPRVQTSGRGGVRCTRIIHRELVDPALLGSTSFSVFRSLSCNPGLAAIFPWLSTQAKSWEQYRFRRLVFEYITRVGSGTKGSVILSPCYDPSDPIPTTEVEASDNFGTREDVVWKDMTMVMDPRLMYALGPRKYVRSGNVAGDVKTYDSAVVYVATNDCADASAIGKIWVSYDVDFYVPQSSPTAGLAATASTFLVGPVPGLTAMLADVALSLSYVRLATKDGLHLGPLVGNAQVALPAGAYHVLGKVRFTTNTLVGECIGQLQYAIGGTPSYLNATRTEYADEAPNSQRQQFDLFVDATFFSNGVDLFEGFVICSHDAVLEYCSLYFTLA